MCAEVGWSLQSCSRNEHIKRLLSTQKYMKDAAGIEAGPTYYLENVPVKEKSDLSLFQPWFKLLLSVLVQWNNPSFKRLERMGILEGFFFHISDYVLT